MKIRFKNDEADTAGKAKRIVLTVQGLSSLRVSFIEDTPEALKEASRDAHAVSWYRCKITGAPEGPVIFQGNLIIPFRVKFPDIKIPTIEQFMLTSKAHIITNAVGLEQDQIAKNNISDIWNFAKWIQNKYWLKEQELKLIINRQWGWVGLIIPAELLGTADGGPRLLAVYQRLAERLLDGWKEASPSSNLTILEPSGLIFNWLEKSMQQVIHQDKASQVASLQLLSTVWLDLRGNQKLFDLASFQESSWFQFDHFNGSPAGSVLYGPGGFQKGTKTTKLAWEIISTVNQLAKTDLLFRAEGLLSTNDPTFNYLIMLKKYLNRWIQRLGDSFQPLSFYCCPAFTQIPAKAALLDRALVDALGALKRDETNLLTNFKAGRLLELSCSCLYIKSAFECGHDCGIDTPFSLPFHPEIDLREQIVQDVSDGFYERGGTLYYLRRRDKLVMNEIPLCPSISVSGLLKDGRATGDILLRQHSTYARALVTSGELRPGNINKFRDKLTLHHFQLQTGNLQIVKLVQKYLHLPSKAHQAVFSRAGWHKDAGGSLRFLHPNEEKVHPLGVEYIQYFPKQKPCLVSINYPLLLPQSQAYLAQFDISGITDTKTKEWSILLICLALSSALLPFAALSGAGYFLWGKRSGNLATYIFSLIYGRFNFRYCIDWPLEQAQPQGEMALAETAKKNHKQYKRGPYQKKLNDLLNTYNHSALLLTGATQKQLGQLKRLGNFLASDKNRTQSQIHSLSALDLGGSEKNQKRSLNFFTCFDDNGPHQRHNGYSGRIINLYLGDIKDEFVPELDTSGLMLTWVARLEREQIGLTGLSGQIKNDLDKFMTNVLPSKKVISTGSLIARLGPMRPRRFTQKEEAARRFGLAAFAGLMAKRMGIFGGSLTELEIMSACQSCFQDWLEQPKKPPYNISPQDIEDTIRLLFFQRLSELKLKTFEQKYKIIPNINKLQRKYNAKLSPWLQNPNLLGLSPGYWLEFDQDKRIATCIVTVPFLGALKPAGINMASFKALLRNAGLLKDETSRTFRISFEEKDKILRGYIFDLSYIFEG